MARPLDEIEYTATRRAGTWDGSWTFSSFTPFTFKGSEPQPVGSEAIEMLDEAARTAARYIIYVQDDQPELYLIERDEEGHAADTVAYNGNTYLVTSDSNWNGRPLGYRGYILLEFAPDEKVPS